MSGTFPPVLRVPSAKIVSKNDKSMVPKYKKSTQTFYGSFSGYIKRLIMLCLCACADNYGLVQLSRFHIKMFILPLYYSTYPRESYTLFGTSLHI